MSSVISTVLDLAFLLVNQFISVNVNNFGCSIFSSIKVVVYNGHSFRCSIACGKSVYIF